MNGEYDLLAVFRGSDCLDFAEQDQIHVFVGIFFIEDRLVFTELLDDHLFDDIVHLLIAEGREERSPLDKFIAVLVGHSFIAV